MPVACMNAEMIVEPTSFEPARFEILVEGVGLGSVRRPLGGRRHRFCFGCRRRTATY
jgi:hypothetical protein